MSTKKKVVAAVVRKPVGFRRVRIRLTFDVVFPRAIDSVPREMVVDINRAAQRVMYETRLSEAALKKFAIDKGARLQLDLVR